MGDSDDEYDRRRRDKFRRERSDYDSRREDRSATTTGGGGGGGGGRRDDWTDRRRGDWQSRERRGTFHNREPYDRNRDRHGMSPPMQKRMRPLDWPQSDDRGGTNAQASVLSFKQYINTLDDSIDEMTAVQKYRDYKLDFQRQQLQSFFNAHKDEEWFRVKYHPETAKRRRYEQRMGVLKRLASFLRVADIMDTLSVDSSQETVLTRLMDAAVIYMEDGSEFDLKILDMDSDAEDCFDDDESGSVCEAERKDSQPYIPDAEPLTPDQKDTLRQTEDIKRRFDTVSPGHMEAVSPEQPDDDDDDLFDDDDDDENTERDGKKDVPVVAAAAAVEGAADAPALDGAVENDSCNKENDRDSGVEDSGAVAAAAAAAGPVGRANRKRKRTEGGEETGSADEEPAVRDLSLDKSNVSTDDNKDENTDQDMTTDGSAKKSEKRPTDNGIGATPGDVSANAPPVAVAQGTAVVVKETGAKPSKPRRPRPLHKTYSLFIRNLPPLITKAEIVQLCVEYTGFLRVALSEPQMDRKFYRRGWISFDRSVNIKDICWTLNNIRLRDSELNPVVNRDLLRRIRPVNGVTLHKQVMRTDIQTCSQLIAHLDKRYSIWEYSSSYHQPTVPDDIRLEPDPIVKPALDGKGNPLLTNIRDHVIEETTAEEDELLGLNTEVADTGLGTIEPDTLLTKVLDKLILYLRIVHSIDFYNASDYPNEDEMPNRCGIIHTRGPAPLTRPSQTELSDYVKSFQSKIAPFLEVKEVLKSDDIKDLGMRNEDEEVVKFIESNTQELSKDKWLCPLSGKKFKGPEFIRKHIHNKHNDKVDEVRHEVGFFNSYLADPKRPQLSDAPSRLPAAPVAESQSSYHSGYHTNNYGGGGGGGGGGGVGGVSGGGGSSVTGGNQPYTSNYNRNMPGFQSGRGNMLNRMGYRGTGDPDKRRDFNQRMGNRIRTDPREIVQYRDLDAPDDKDIF